jgi:PAS domain S-box-containing protein
MPRLNRKKNFAATGGLAQLTPHEAGRPALDSTPPAAMIVVGADERVLHVEGAAFARHGVQVEDWAGRHLADALPGEAAGELMPRYQAALRGEAQSFDYWSQDGRHAYWVQIAPIQAQEHERTSVVAVIQDITERLRVTSALARSEARLREAERMVGVGSWELDLSTDTFTYSPGLARLMGLPPEGDLTVSAFVELVHPEDRRVLRGAIDECVETGSASCEFRVEIPDGGVRIFTTQGEAVRGEADGPGHLRGATLDVTVEREGEHERLAALSIFRQGFDSAPIGMALTDPEVGRYLRVNDAMCALLGRSREELVGSTIDSVTHPDDRRSDQGARRAMLEGGDTGFQAEKRYLRPDGSAVWTTLHTTPVRNTDGSVEAFFSQIVDISERKERETRLEQDASDGVWLARIRAALDEDRLLLYRQPIVDLKSGETVQHELMLRMRGQDGSLILPGEFLPIAERYGLISEVDRWVIRRAVEVAGGGEATEFNLSGSSIGDPDVLRELATAIEESGVDPSLLVVEVTETAIIDQLEAGRIFAEGVTDLGCRLALDDFGTGFASLTYLKHIPAHHLKIDIEFVHDLTQSPTDRRLVEGIIAFARAFDQITIAEGVEDEATLVLLRDLGADRAQGYLLGRPAPFTIEPGAPVGPPSSDGGQDPVALVRQAFDDFARRDLDALLKRCRDDVLLRAPGTTKMAGKRVTYHGHDGIREYFEDVMSVWGRLILTPISFRQAEQSVIAFGRVEGELNNEIRTTDVLWIWRLRDGIVSSVEAFERPAGPPGAASALRPGRATALS